MPIEGYNYGSFDTSGTGPEANLRRKRVLDVLFGDVLSQGLEPPGSSQKHTQQTSFEDGGLSGFANRSFGGGGGPSPGGLDLNALLQRGIAGNIAGAQEETGIKRRQVAGDLLSQQLTQAAQELQNRMQGYEFGQTQSFDRALGGGDPRLAATLTDIARQGGVNWMTAPGSRLALGAFEQGGKQVLGHHELAAGILRNWQLSEAAALGGREPPEVSWARNVLGVPGATTGTSTNAPALQRPITGATNQVPYGLGRAALGSAVTGAGAYAGGKYLPQLAGKLAPKLAPKLAAHPSISALIGAIISGTTAEAGYESLVDPKYLQAVRENPKTAAAAGVLGGYGASKIRIPARSPGVTGGQQAVGNALGGLLEERGVNFRPRLLNAPPSGVASTAPAPSIGGTAGGPQIGDFVRRFKTFYGRNPTQQELEQFSRGFAPTAQQPGPRQLNAPSQQGPYKPKVRGYEEFLQKQFGQ